MNKLIIVLVVFFNLVIFPKEVESASNIHRFLEGYRFGTCAETEVQMEIKFFENMRVTVVYKSDWWNDEKSKREEFVKEQTGKYEVLKNRVVKIVMPDRNTIEFLFGHNVNLMGGSFPHDGLVFLKKSGGSKDSVFSSMESETTFFYKNACQFYYDVERRDLKTAKERSELRRKYYLEKLEKEQSQELKTLFMNVMDNNVEAIKIQLKQNNKLAGMLSYWGDTPFLFTFRYYTALQDLNSGINISILKLLLENGANPNQKEILTGLNNPAVAKMFAGWSEKTALSWIESMKKLKNKDDVINLLKKYGAKE
ncbi:MAG: hypothetical protein RBT87_07245 [bacterium]|jgi:hypothetical protein|nr:hypothetical protein [bacterium]